MTLDGSRLPYWDAAESDGRGGACLDDCPPATPVLLLARIVRAGGSRLSVSTMWMFFVLGSLFLSLMFSAEANAVPYARPGVGGARTQALTANRLPHPAVARIIVPEGDGTSYGSGTLVDVRDRYALVITNWHVVRDFRDEQGTIEVVFPDGFRSPARAVKMDSDWDLAALVIWRPPASPATLARRAPQPGDVLTIAGYGRGDYRTATGRCTQYLAPGAEFPFEMVELNVEARQGDSGGPIFNEQGEMAGVLFGAANGTTSGSYCGRVSGFLASLAPDMKPGQSFGEREMIARARRSNRMVTRGVGSRGSDSDWRAVSPPGRHDEIGFDQEPDFELAENPPPRGRSAQSNRVANNSAFPYTSKATREPAALAAMSGALFSDAPVSDAPVPDAQVSGAPNSDSATGPVIEGEVSPGAGRVSVDRSPGDGKLLDGEATLEAASTPAISWRNLAGETLFDQIKTVLACIGGCVVLWQVFRFVG